MEIKKVQILPMSEEGFLYENRDLSFIQIQYFLYELKTIENGRYYYEISGISEPNNTLIFFKFRSQIIAQGNLIGKSVDSKGKYLQFDSDSISIFIKPISVEEIQIIWSDYKEPGMVKVFLDINHLDNFYKQYSTRLFNNDSIEDLFQIQTELSNSDNLLIDIKPIQKIEKKRSNINYTARDSNISKKAITNADHLCEFNSEHKLFTSKYTQRNYVEAHHLIPIEFSDKFEYSLDVIANIVSLCPVCHKKIHYANFDDKKEIILKLFNDRKDNLVKSGLSISIDDLTKFYGNI